MRLRTETCPDGLASTQGGTGPWIDSPEFKFGNNVLWGCPSWKRMTLVGTTYGAFIYAHGLQHEYLPVRPFDTEKPTGNFRVNQWMVAQQNLDGYTSYQTGARSRRPVFRDCSGNRRSGRMPRSER